MCNKKQPPVYPHQGVAASRYFGELIKPLLLKHDEPDSNVATEYTHSWLGTPSGAGPVVESG